MLFYRGIAVPSDAVAGNIDRIRREGLQVRDEGFRSGFQDLKPHLDRVWSLARTAAEDVDMVISSQVPSAALNGATMTVAITTLTAPAVGASTLAGPE